MSDTPAGGSSGTPSSSAATNARMEQAVGIGADVLDQVQDVLKGGRIRAIRIKLGSRTLREIPVEAAAFTAILLAAAAVVVSQLRIEIEKY